MPKPDGKASSCFCVLCSRSQASSTTAVTWKSHPFQPVDVTVVVGSTTLKIFALGSSTLSYPRFHKLFLFEHLKKWNGSNFGLQIWYNCFEELRPKYHPGQPQAISTSVAASTDSLLWEVVPYGATCKPSRTQLAHNSSVAGNSTSYLALRTQVC